MDQVDSLNHKSTKEEDKIEVFMIDEVIRIDSQIVKTGDSIDKTEVDLGMKKIYRRGNFRGNVKVHQNFERQNSRGEYRNNFRNESYGRSRDRNRSRER